MKGETQSYEIGLPVNSYFCSCETNHHFATTTIFDCVTLVIFWKERMIACEIIVYKNLVGGTKF